MNNQRIENIYLFLISILPLSIIIGPSISLSNILLIVLFFFSNLKFAEINIQNKKIFYLLILLYIYLIFNSFISIDYKEGIFRNLGFVRFIILFLAINFYFYISENNQKFFNIWSIIILILVFDSFFEFFFGKNLLGYGDDLYNNRIVSFFRDEPIVGAYLLGFKFIIVGYFFEKLYKKKPKIENFFILNFIYFCKLYYYHRRTFKRNKSNNRTNAVFIFK